MMMTYLALLPDSEEAVEAVDAIVGDLADVQQARGAALQLEESSVRSQASDGGAEHLSER